MKKFLSDYGFTILAVIVVITLITFSSPIGSAIQKQTTNTVQSLGKVVENDLNKIDDSVSLIDLTNINKSGVIGDFSRKGNLVTINDNLFRVLSIEGTQAKVIMMDNYTNAQFNTVSTTTSFSGNEGQQYAGSNLDNVMIGYYDSLPTEIQNAIVEQNINQSMYSWTAGIDNSANFSSFYTANFNESTTSGNNYYLTRIADINVGARKVYALDVDDVISYLGTYATPQELNELFFNERNSKPYLLWLRSARYNDSEFVCGVYGDLGFLNRNDIRFNRIVRPAFMLDLSLLS